METIRKLINSLKLRRSRKLEYLLQQLLNNPCLSNTKLPLEKFVFCEDCENPCREYKRWHKLLTYSYKKYKL